MPRPLRPICSLSNEPRAVVRLHDGGQVEVNGRVRPASGGLRRVSEVDDPGDDGLRRRRQCTVAVVCAPRRELRFIVESGDHRPLVIAHAGWLDRVPISHRGSATWPTMTEAARSLGGRLYSVLYGHVMSNIDRQRVTAVRALERFGFIFNGNDWTAPVQACPSVAEADRLHALLVMRAEALEECCRPYSREADELVTITDAIESYEAVRWPDGKVPSGKG
jgi:hypothetical protein